MGQIILSRDFRQAEMGSSLENGISGSGRTNSEEGDFEHPPLPGTLL